MEHPVEPMDVDTSFMTDDIAEKSIRHDKIDVAVKQNSSVSKPNISLQA